MSQSRPTLNYRSAEDDARERRQGRWGAAVFLLVVAMWLSWGLVRFVACALGL